MSESVRPPQSSDANVDNADSGGGLSNAADQRSGRSNATDQRSGRSNATDQRSGRPARSSRRSRRRVVKFVKRALLIAVGGGLVAAIVVAFLPKPVPVDFGDVTRGPLTVTVSEDGKTRVKDRYVVIAPLTGNMPRLGLSPGDAVTEGQVLTRIVPAAPPLLDSRTRAEAQARLAAAQAGQRQAQANASRVGAAHEQAVSLLARQKPLAADGALPKATAERAEYDARVLAEELRSAEFAIKVAEQQAASARAALGYLSRRSPENEPQLEVPSPISGQVLRVFRQDQGLVQAGSQLLELGDPASLELVVDVLTRDAVKIQPGARVSIVRWGGDDALSGRVQRVEPSAFTRVSSLGVEEQRVNVIVTIADARDRWSVLGDGYRVEVSIVVWEAEDVLSVPASSVFRHGDGWAVYRADAGVAALAPVEIGRRNERRVEIVSGIVAGARVVLHPSDRISEGVSVIARDAAGDQSDK